MSERKERLEELSPLKRAYVALEAMEARLREFESAAKEPIALVGMGCRAPGGAKDPESFWRLLRDGVDAVGEAPAERWKPAPFDASDPREAWRESLRWGGFLEGVDRFDPLFFGISPREAVSMDPQQRLLLEVAWEALENAGQAPDGLSGSATGVFMALCSNDYSFLQIQGREPEEIDAHYGSGISHGMAAGRISYLLGLQGPSLVVDTACSSSLVAIHLACQSLRLGECRMALAGGVNLILTRENYVTFAKAGMLSRTGRCRTFDAAADGFARSEGCGVVVLKRLRDALADGDLVHAIVRGSAVNQDGPSTGLTAPNGQAQQAVIRAALDDAGVDPAEISYVEAHGTGTLLGDPIELRALGEALGRHEEDRRRVRVGSVKTNFGHAEAAAGVLGLIKVVLALEHEEIPKHLHFERPNPHVDWNDLPFEVPREASPWPRVGARRAAGVSSFGFSGTNAHIVLEEAEAPRQAAGASGAHLFTCSAKSDRALSELVSSTRSRLIDAPELSLQDVCFTANSGRARFERRIAVTARSTAELAERLGSEETWAVRSKAIDEPRIAFLFTGQGSQYVGMGRGLFETHSVFRKSLERSQEILRPHLPLPLLSVLYPEDSLHSPLDDTRYTQPGLFAFEYALFELWRSFGVSPAVVLGHSIGEYVAAAVAGVITLEDGLFLAAERGRLMQSIRESGAMAAVFADEERVRRAIAPYGDRVAIAAVNGPAHVVLSGAAETVGLIRRELRSSGVESRELRVSHAFHSPLMNPILGDLEAILSRVQLRPPSMRLISNLMGRPAGPEVATARYWREHAAGTVRFAEGLASVRELPVDAFLELGPGTTLVDLAADAVAEATPAKSEAFISSLGKSRDDSREILEALAALFKLGAPLDWKGVYADGKGRPVPLPTYPFQRERYWVSSSVAPTRKGVLWLHPLLERRISSPALGGAELFTAKLSPSSPDFLGDHRILGKAIFPTTAYLEMVLAGVEAVFGRGHHALEDVLIREPLRIEDDGTDVQLVLRADSEESASFEVYGGASPELRLHASGRALLHAAGKSDLARAEALEELKGRSRERLSVSDYYEALLGPGYEYGRRFKVLQELYRGDREALGRIELAEGLSNEPSSYRVHPTLLDAAIQLIGPAVFDPKEMDRIDTFVPLGIERFEVFRKPAPRLWCHARVSPDRGEPSRLLSADLRLLDDAGQIVAAMKNLELAPLPKSGDEKLSPEWLYEIEWIPSPGPTHAAPSVAGEWLLLFHDEPARAARLAERLRESGARSVLRAVSSLESGEGIPSNLRGVVYFASVGSESVDQPAASLMEIQRRSLGGLLGLVQALAARNAEEPLRLIIVTEDAQPAGVGFEVNGVGLSTLAGFARTLLIEHPELRAMHVDLERGVPDQTERIFEALSRGDEEALAFRGGVPYASRLVASHRPSARETLRIPGGAFRLEIGEPGLLEKLSFRPVARVAPGRGEIEIEIQATSLNFRDVLNALGMYPGDSGPLGTECAGVVSRLGEGVEGFREGDEVVAALTAATFARYVTAPSYAVYPKPRGLSLEEAASFPNVFLTARYGLETLAKMKAGERVLIHAAAGGVGLAAVALAQRTGAEVFATAGSRRKRAYLSSLGVRHVMDSRTLDFAEEVLAATGGEGVDIVLNSLSGDFIEKSLAVLKPSGRFIEIGKRGVWGEERVRERVPGASYFLLDVGASYHREPERMQSDLRFLSDAFEKGELEPLPYRVFPLEETVEAFRTMAQARHIGKVVVSRRDAGLVPVSARKTYLVTGGYGSLGRSVARWLSSRGARHLVLAGRRGAAGADPAFVRELKASGVEVELAQADVSSERDVFELVARIEATMPPLGGVVHAAGTLDDGVLVQQSWTRFEKVLAPKVAGAWNLHLATRARPLDFFVLFSSTASYLGSAGQANYAAANAFLDALAHHRKARGLPALTVNWGPWREAGMASSSGRLEERYRGLGLGFLTEGAAFEALERLLREDRTGATVQKARFSALVRQYEASVPALFRLVEGAPPKLKSAANGGALTRAILEAPLGERRHTLKSRLRELACGVLGLSHFDAASERRPLSELGLDSLLAVELRNAVAGELGRSLPATLMFKYPTLEALEGFVWREALSLGEAENRAAKREASELSMEEQAVASLSEEDARRMLAKELASLSPEILEGAEETEGIR